MNILKRYLIESMGVTVDYKQNKLNKRQRQSNMEKEKREILKGHHLKRGDKRIIGRFESLFSKLREPKVFNR